MKRNQKRFANSTVISVKSVFCLTLALLLVNFLLPLTLLHLPRSEETAEASVPAETEGEPAEPESSSAAIEDAAQGSTLTVLLDGETQSLALEDYLWGVVAAEMPAAFDSEALKAQAVAARTYTLYRMEHPGDAHPQAALCGDPGCCQAWMSRAERKSQWATKDADAYEKKLNQAISETEGLTLCYGGEPILAAFHAASAGSTKSALEVWGEDYPYLQEVASPEDDSSVPNYYSKVTLTPEEFSEKFLAAYPKAELSPENRENWFGDFTYDEAGLPLTVEIGGLTADTGDVRTLFDLRSASFTVECQEDSVTFYVTGYGHGVGMSQYGANALAKEGKTFREILAWYYPGTELKKV